MKPNFLFRITFRITFRAICLLLTIGSAAHAESTENRRLPNILLIMVDDLGYGDLSSYGGKDIHTPHIDRLMSEGMRFNEFYANSCVCSPTRAALLSGRYPEFVGIPGVVRHYREGNWGYLLPGSIMLPQLFQQSGYHTSLIGKWHLGLEEENWPNNRGFDEFHGWLGDMMEDYWKHTRAGINHMRRNKEVIQAEGHATDVFTQWSVASFQRQAKTGKPWFQYLAYTAPHDPIQPPKEWLEKVKERESGISDARAGIVALIEHLDHGIGEVLATLESTRQDHNTLVIFTSDNGGDLRFSANNGPLRSGKTHVYEGGLKVPTCFRWPGRIRPAQTTDFRALTMDIIPTLADLCGISISHEINGMSFKTLLLEGEQAPFERAEFFMWLQKTHKEAIRLGDWKCVRNTPDAPPELYHIKQDPLETTDLSKAEPERLRDLIEKLEAHLAKTQQIPWQKPKK